METDPHPWIRALRTSHDALAARVASLSPTDLEHSSYCRDWDVSQVLSHLGSGAEISLTGLERALAGLGPIDRAEFPVIWERWNTMTPADRALQFAIWDRRSVSVLEGLDEATLGRLRLPMLGMDLDVATAVGFRLGEHAVHSWDVAVIFDPAAEVLGSSAELVVDRLGFIVARVGKPSEAAAPRRIEIRTSGPDRRFLLALEDGAELTEHMGGQVDGSLALPATALVRLVYGRLDPGHTPAGVTTEGDADLDELRRVFPGF